MENSKDVNVNTKNILLDTGIQDIFTPKVDTGECLRSSVTTDNYNTGPDMNQVEGDVNQI